MYVNQILSVYLETETMVAGMVHFQDSYQECK